MRSGVRFPACLAILALLIVASPGVNAAVSAASTIPWCGTSQVTSGGSTAAANFGLDGYVPLDCSPTVAWASPYGGAEAQLYENSVGSRYGTTADTHLVVVSSGNAYMLWGPKANPFVITQLRELSPSGAVLWSTPDVGASDLIGTGHIVVTTSQHGAVIIDPATHAVTRLDLQFERAYEPATGGTAIHAAVVGGLAAFPTVITTRAHEKAGKLGDAEVQVFDAAGREVRQFALPSKVAPAQADMYTSVQVVGDNSYWLYSDAPEGRADAGVYELTAQDALAGPYAVPASLTAFPFLSFIAVGHGRLLLEGTSYGSSQSKAALLDLEGATLHVVWTRMVPGSSPVLDGSYVVNSGPLPPIAGTHVAVIDWSNGAVRKTFSFDHSSLQVLAAGPFGLVVYASLVEAGQEPPCTGICPASPSALNRLQLLDPNGHVVWSAPVAAPLTGRSAFEAAQLLDVGGRDALTLGPPGLAVVWSGPAPSAAPQGWPYQFARVAASAPATPIPSSPVAGYGVFLRGKAIDARHPLVVSAGTASHTYHVTIAAVTARGVRLASPRTVWVVADDEGAGGRLGGNLNTAPLEIRAGQSGVTLHFVPGRAGRFEFAVYPWTQRLPGYPPAVPSIIPAGSPIVVRIDLTDANGVTYAVTGREQVVVIGRGSGMDGQPVTAHRHGQGQYEATVRTGRADSSETFAAGIESNGRLVAPLSTAVTATTIDAAAPTIQAVPVAGGVRIHVVAPSGSHPIGYALYRTSSGSSSRIGSLVAILDPDSYAVPNASYMDHVGPGGYRYTAEAVYASGGLGEPSSAIDVQVKAR